MTTTSPTPNPTPLRKTVLITGASRGIGAATALLAAQQGYAVIVHYRRDAAAAVNVLRQIAAAGGTAIAMKADVAVESEIMAMFLEIDTLLVENPGWGRFAGLVNNAGIVAQSSRLQDMDTARLQRMFDTNILGSVLCAREAVKRMAAQPHDGKGQRGAIVNVSSVASRLGGAGNYVDYAASKGAIDTFTIGLAREVAGDGIRVNAVRPGIIDTEIHASGGQPNRVKDMASQLPMGRAGTAGEVAEAIVWLLGDGAGYTSGALIDVAGGR